MTPIIGEQLKQARLDRKLTIQKAAQATAVRAKFLEALEADDFTSLPSPLQARGFLRIYAEFLGLDAEPMLATLRGEKPVEQDAATQGDQSEPVSETAASTDIETSDNEKTNSDEAEPPVTESLYPISQALENLDTEEPEIQPEESSSPLPLSQSIFTEIGQQLKGRRELLSLTLEEIERHTRIRKHYLEALEAGAIGDLPSPVQARGILSSYAQFLDLDADSVLLRYAEGLQALRKERHPYKPQPKKIQPEEGNSTLPPVLRNVFTTDLLVGGGIILAMIVFAVWGANRIISQREQEQGNTQSQQSISAALLGATSVTAQPTEIVTPTLEVVAAPATANARPTTLELSTVVKSSPVQVTIATSGETWMRVTVDGKVQFQGRTAAGSASTYDGVNSVDVLVADGAQVQIIYNGTNMGPMGDSGAITEVIYTPTGAIRPTPTSTPIPTRTPRATPTFTPSRTPTPNNTTVPQP